MVRLKFALTLLMLTPLTISCTRKTSVNATVRLALPQSANTQGAAKRVAAAPPDTTQPTTPSTGVAAAATISTIILNVSGSGINKPVFFQWDSHCGNASCQSAPSTVSLDVPKGDGRLFQALIVFDGVGTSSSSIYYGDTTTSVSTDGQPIEISVGAAGSANSGDSQVAGRYLNADGTGPTGHFSVYFPVPGKPSMLVHTGEIFGGWFSVFALEGKALDYVLDSGTEIFSTAMSVDTIAMPAGVDSGQTMRVRFPASFHQNGDSSSARQGSAPSREALGYFGPGASGKKICWPSTSVNIPYVYTSPSSSDPTTLLWNPFNNSTGSTDVFVEPVNGGAVGGVSTSQTDGSGLCTVSGGTRFVDYISMDPKALASHDALLGFRGAYQNLPTGTNSGFNGLKASMSTDTLTVSWRYLPGVYSAGGVKRLDGSDVFVRMSPVANSNGQADYQTDGGVACQNLPNLGFTMVKSVAVDATSGTLDVSTTINSLPPGFADSFNNGKAAVVVCPYVVAGGKMYYQGGVDFRSYGNGGGGGGVSSSPATSMAISSSQFTQSSPIVVGDGLCIPFSAYGLNGSQSAAFPAGTEITMTSESALVGFYSDASCTTALMPQYEVSGSTGLGFYVRVDESGAGTHQIQATLKSPTLSAPAPLTIQYQSSPAAYQSIVRISAPSQIVAQACYHFSMEGWALDTTTNNYLIYPLNATFTLPTSADLQFFADSSSQCSGTAVTNFELAGSQLIYSGWFRYTGSSTSTSLQPSTSTSGISYSQGPIGVSQPGTPAKAMFNMPSSIEQNTCVPFHLTLMDSNGNPTVALSTTTVTLAMAGGNTGYFATDASCYNTQVTQPVNFSAGQGDAQLYYVGTQITTANLTATGSAIAGSFALTITPPSARQVLIALPGQTYNPGSGISGAPIKQAVGIGFPANLYAVKPDNTVDTTFNGTLANLSVPANLSTPPYYAIVFSNGVATIPVTGTMPGYGSLNGTVNLNNGPANFYSSSIEIFQPATMISVYMNSAASLLPGACQIFMVVPEDMYGYADPNYPGLMYSFSTVSGQVYTDNVCTTPASGSIPFDATSKYNVFYYKSDIPSTSDTIMVGSNMMAPANFPVATIAGGSVGTGSAWALLGRSGTSSTPNRCMPFVAYVQDSSGMNVPPATDVTTLTFAMGSLSGTAGAFTDMSDCSTGWIDGSPQTLSAAVGYRATYGMAPAWSMGSESLNVSGSPYAPTSTTLSNSN